MDLNEYQKRLKKRRIKFAVAISIVFGLVLFMRVFLNGYLFEAKPLNSYSPAESPTQVETASQENWQQIVTYLDSIRVNAITHRDTSLLSSVYVGNSPLKVQDEKLITNLIDSQAEIVGLTFGISNLYMLSHRWSNDEEVVELSFMDTRSGYEVKVNGELVQKVPEKSSNWLISLVKTGDSWLIGNATPKSSDG